MVLKFPSFYILFSLQHFCMLLFCRCKTDRVVLKFSKHWGIDPLKLFWDKTSVSRETISHIFLGISPKNRLLEPKKKIVEFGNNGKSRNVFELISSIYFSLLWITWGGPSKLLKEFWEMFTYRNTGSFHNHSGTWPLIWLVEISKYTNLVYRMRMSRFLWMREDGSLN